MPLSSAGCFALPQTGPYGKPESCYAPVHWAGLAVREPLGGRPVEAWLTFACDAHRDHLIASRELLERDHETLNRRRAQQRGGASSTVNEKTGKRRLRTSRSPSVTRRES